MVFTKPKTSIEDVQYGGFNFQLKRSIRRRRTLSLLVKGPDNMIVSAPWKTPITEVYKLLDSKRDWIHLQLERSAEASVPTLTGEVGDKVFYLGKHLSLCFQLAEQNAIRITEDVLLIEHKDKRPNQTTAVRQVKRKLRSEAENLLPEKVAFWSEKMNLVPAAVKIKQYKARWGSCSKNAELQFNWRLIGADEATIDYVVVHELAHLKHFNHSAKFWLLVAQFQPNYKIQKRWLKENGSCLML